MSDDSTAPGTARKRHGFWEVFTGEEWVTLQAEPDEDTTDWIRRQSIPLGRKKGDPLHSEHEVADFRETMRIRIFMQPAALPSHDYEHYAATRYYHASVHPDDDDILTDTMKSIVCEVSKHDFGRAYGGFGGFAEQNMVLEELWFKHGGD